MKHKADADAHHGLKQRSLHTFFAPAVRLKEQHDEASPLKQLAPGTTMLQPTVVVAAEATTADNRHQQYACQPLPLASFAWGRASPAVDGTTDRSASAPAAQGTLPASQWQKLQQQQAESGATAEEAPAACTQQQVHEQQEQQDWTASGVILQQQQQRSDTEWGQVEESCQATVAGAGSSRSSMEIAAIPDAPGSVQVAVDSSAAEAAAAGCGHLQYRAVVADAAGKAKAAAAAAEALAAAGGGCGLTEYELQRLKRIRRNQEVMLSMGLGGPGIEPKMPAAAAPSKRRPRRKRAPAGEGVAAAAAVAPQPLLRCTRARGGSAVAGSEVVAVTVPSDAPLQPGPKPELEFDVSSVRRYVCEVLMAPDGGEKCCRAAGGGHDVPGARVSGFCQLPGCLHDPALARAYSLDWQPGLVVAGGKDGVVSVFGSRELESGLLGADGGAPPLLSHRLHKGWVSDVQFAFLPSSSSSSSFNSGSGGSGDTTLLLTAGNDGAVCLWDLGRAVESCGGGGMVPQCLSRAPELHHGGIFSLHEQDGRVLTASKDSTLAISSLGGSSGTASLAAVQRYAELHEGVVKCARWRQGCGATTFASCGNDRTLRVVDSRQPPATGASLAVEGVHGTAINCLRWHPANDHLLLTASHDPAILLHDLRSPAQPLHRLMGHASGSGRISAIYQPAWVAGGAAVATGCERSQLLSLYCSASGATISRGDAGITPGATFCGGRQSSDPLICTAARAVYLFQPSWVFGP